VRRHAHARMVRRDSGRVHAVSGASVTG
jgi:hypothetical protein